MQIAYTNEFGKVRNLNDNVQEPANAAMHGPHSLVRFGPGCAGRA